MPVVLIVVIAIIVIALVAVGAIMGSRKRSEQLRGRFGPEYDRMVQARGGDRAAAERELSGRVHRRKDLKIVALPELQRQQYHREWEELQTRFVDAPQQSLAAADALVERVMRERGYPMGEFDQRAADISVDHPDVVDHYRAAHAVSMVKAGGQSNTEEQRQAMIHYRALFDELLQPAGADERRPQDERGEYAATHASGGPQAAAPPPPATGTDTTRSAT